MNIADVLSERAMRAGVTIPEALASQLIVYYDLLTHWNRKINLTSLSDPSQAVDRLLLEPVAAAADLPSGTDLVDLGSGGGSPAIPLALATQARNLVMVESRGRKGAFLREALRELALAGAVETRRFEELAVDQGFRESFGLLSVRAVRLDKELFFVVSNLLRSEGVAALFGSALEPDLTGLPASLSGVSTSPLLGASERALTRLVKA